MSTIEITREIEIETTDEEGGVTVLLSFEVEVSGRHYPATWGYDGGSPEEFPEAEIVSVSWQPTGSGPWVQVPSCWWPMTERDIEDIESEAVQSAMDDRGEDRYDDRDDDRDDRDYA